MCQERSLEFVVNETKVAADPYVEEITRFGGYRGIFTIAEGKRVARPFRWDGDTALGVNLPPNNRIVIYEMASASTILLTSITGISSRHFVTAPPPKAMVSSRESRSSWWPRTRIDAL